MLETQCREQEQRLMQSREYWEDIVAGEWGGGLIPKADDPDSDRGAAEEWEKLRQLKAERELAWEAWHACCLEWLDVLEEL